MPLTIDNLDADFSEQGSSWVQGALTGSYLDNYRAHPAGTGANSAAWTASDLEPGRYQVFTTWVPHSNRATNAPYTVLDGSTSVGTASVNQQNSPTGLNHDGAVWTSLGTFTISGGSLTVRLTDAADGYVIADAVHIVYVSPPSLGLGLDDGNSGHSEQGSGWVQGILNDGYLGDYRAVAAGTGANSATWTASNLAAGQYQVYATWVSYANRATNAPYTILDGSTVVGAKSVNQQQSPSGLSFDGATWSSLGTFTIAGNSLTVRLTDAANGYVIADGIHVVYAGPPPVGQALDDGDPGYAEQGTGWVQGGLAGAYLGDYRAHAAGTGANSATWTATDLVAGQYQIYATWLPHANRATNAPYTFLDGTTTVGSASINQTLAPSGLIFEGKSWTSLGTATIAGTSLTVRLTDAANGFIIADGIRIVRVNAAPVFTNPPFLFEVPENSPNGTVVGTAGATDADSETLTYSIIAGNESGAFAISDQGVITVADSNQLDYELIAQHHLVVAVNDGTTTTNVAVVVTVSDVNDPPVFDGDTVFDVPPDVVDGTVVGSVHASDQDSGQTVTYSLVDGLGLFAIDPQNGEISVTDAAGLDDTVLYDLTVEANDGNGGIVQTQIQVNPQAIRMSIDIAPLNYQNNALILVNITGRTPNTRVVLKLDSLDGPTISGYFATANGPLLNEATAPMVTDANGNLSVLIPASALPPGLHVVHVGRRNAAGGIAVTPAPRPGISLQFRVLQP